MSDQWMEQYEERLRAERVRALEAGEETALECEWPVKWDVGAPLPHVISSGHKVFLMYLVRKPEPEWDGTYTNVIDPSRASTHPITLVEFTDCYVFKFGGPNDEVSHGHPLRGKGVEAYQAHIVANSRWIEEAKLINSVHSLYNPNSWAKTRHYLLLFHDETFECIASGYKIEVFRASLEAVMEIAMRRLFQD